MESFLMFYTYSKEGYKWTFRKRKRGICVKKNLILISDILFYLFTTANIIDAIMLINWQESTTK